MAQASCANPLMLGWVKEWWDTARERNSKGVTTFKHAYDSLKACPITFGHPSSLQQLKGFGPKLCERLTDKLKQHCEENGLPMPSVPRGKKRGANLASLGGDDEEDASSGPVKKPRKVKQYMPTYRSGAYALVLALSTLEETSRSGMTKTELIEKAQPHCDSSFTAPSDPTKFYTAWASMKTLAQKDLVYEKGRPLKKYGLTDEGWEVAKRIRQAAIANGTLVGTETGAGAGAGGVNLPNTVAQPASGSGSGNAAATSIARPPHSGGAAMATGVSSRRTATPLTFFVDDDDDGSVDDEDIAARVQNGEYGSVVADGDKVPDGTALPTFTPIRLNPGMFTVELVLDVREVRAKTDRDYMQEELTKKGVKPIMKALELGDALWVAKCNRPGWLARQGAEGDEVVLDWIVERKRLDDLIGSIKDGRFHEQKFRLRRSGVKNVIYLVEEISMDSTHFQKYEEAVQSATASIQVVNGYFLKKTQKMDDTIRYLASMTRLLKKLYEAKPLFVIPTHILTAKNYMPLLNHIREKQPSASHHISYPAFASLASKSDMMTLRDVYLKMLMCTKGVTGEKAVEIQKVWKTPNHFIKALDQCGSGEDGKKQRISLVSTRLGNLVGCKKIPKPVIQKIVEVWGDA
ncbi:ERCC4 domain-containing protein [Lasiosphaeria miniovina]|uniref:Crossover junction endonuclease MUS81 n=1 Tax=Lasiosphaeria miniovina TaxID=1954250 RepID=A0AA40EEF5_9PEZI|nr:ERCC4 domain-containing protein [Lasiosphaeria miniovina]KAK0734436.1 ERCC4 domain-containing protein [Lasiosphaeria miniovina]